MLFENRTRNNSILNIVVFHSLLQIKSYSVNYPQTRSKVNWPLFSSSEEERLKKKL